MNVDTLYERAGNRWDLPERTSPAPGWSAGETQWQDWIATNLFLESDGVVDTHVNKQVKYEDDDVYHYRDCDLCLVADDGYHLREVKQLTCGYNTSDGLDKLLDLTNIEAESYGLVRVFPLDDADTRFYKQCLKTVKSFTSINATVDLTLIPATDNEVVQPMTFTSLETDDRACYTDFDEATV